MQSTVLEAAARRALLEADVGPAGSTESNVVKTLSLQPDASEVNTQTPGAPGESSAQTDTSGKNNAQTGAASKSNAPNAGAQTAGAPETSVPEAGAPEASAPEASAPVKSNSISEQTAPVRTSASRAQIRRLPPLAKRAVLAQQTMQDCCEGKCGMENPQRIVSNIARAAQEVINGARPITQLMRWLTADTYDAIRRRLSVQARSARPARRAVTVTSCHICRINHDTVEGTVVLSDGGRVRAAVVRLEAFRGRWRASYLQTI